MSNNLSGKALLILGLTGALGVAALALYVKAEPGAAKVAPSLRRQEPSDDEPIRSVRRKKAESDDDQDDANKTAVSVYLPKIDGPDADLKNDTVPVPAGQDPLAFVAGACLKEANAEGSKVLSVVLRHKIAVINFNKEIDSGMGEEQEGSFLKALQVSFGQFKNVRQVELEREGEPLTTLGSIEISGPLDVLRPGESPDRSSKPPEP